MLTRKGENASPSNWQNGSAFELTPIQLNRSGNAGDSFV